MRTESRLDVRARTSRRRFLTSVAGLGVVASASSLLVACGGQAAAPAPATAPPKPAEAAKPAAPAATVAAPPQATTATASATPATKPIEFKVRTLNTTPVIDSQLAFTSVGSHPRLGFYAMEGLENEYVGLQGADSVIGALATGKAETGSFNPLNVLPAAAEGRDPGLKVIYLQHQKAYWEVRVLPDSPIQQYSDLKGKKIGMIREGDTGLNAARIHLRQLGIDPDKEVEWAGVGQGGSAGNALKTGQVDALAIWDAEFARIELLGYEMRVVPNPPGTELLFGFGIATKSSLDWRQHIPKYMRGYFKSSIFTITNPEAAVKLHWDLYPDSKPSGKPEAEALREQITILNVRAPYYGAIDASGKQDLKGAWGYSDPARWQAWVQFLGLQDEIPDPSVFYTNEFVEEANQFDKDAIIAMAKDFQL